jgi:hypothetical protein
MPLYGPPTSRDHYPSALEANLRKAFLDNYSDIGRRIHYYTRIYNVETSRIKNERHAVYAGYGTYETKEEGGPIIWDSGQEAWNANYVHRTFTLGAEFTREAVEDDLHGVIKWLMKSGGGLAYTAAYTKERDAMNLFNTLATSGTVYTAGGTAYSLLSTTHYRIDGGTWSNRPAADMDLSIEALEFAVSHWYQNQRNQRGQLVMTAPATLLTGTGDWALARRLIETTRGRPQSADNDKNVIQDIVKDTFAHPLLTNDGRWFLFGDKEDTGLTYYERVKPDVERWPDGDTGNMRMVGRYRSSWGATHVYGIWGSP